MPRRATTAAWKRDTRRTATPGRCDTRLGELPDRSAALEIGTGNGALLAHLRALGFAEVLGIEPSRAAADSAEPDVRPMIRVESFDAERLPESKFALIIANQTLEHVENPYGLLEAARRLLRPGGALMAVSHNYRHPLMRLLGARSPIIDIGHLQVFSPRSLEFALKRARFGAVEIRPFANRYPLHYWVRLMPIPRAIKRPLHGWLRRASAGEGRRSRREWGTWWRGRGREHRHFDASLPVARMAPQCGLSRFWSKNRSIVAYAWRPSCWRIRPCLAPG